MNTRRIFSIVSLGLALTATACSGDSEVPRATIENGIQNECIVEASFLGYHFTNPPIGPDGVMADREVVPGSDYAYAVVVKPAQGEDCFKAAEHAGGELWVTKDKQSVQKGELLRIRFDTTSAQKIETKCSAEYVKGLGMFNRLPNPC